MECTRESAGLARQLRSAAAARAAVLARLDDPTANGPETVWCRVASR